MSEEENINDRKKKNQLWQDLPSSSNPSKEEHFGVEYNESSETLTTQSYFGLKTRLKRKEGGE